MKDWQQEDGYRWCTGFHLNNNKLVQGVKVEFDDCDCALLQEHVADAQAESAARHLNLLHRTRVCPDKAKRCPQCNSTRLLESRNRDFEDYNLDNHSLTRLPAGDWYTITECTRCGWKQDSRLPPTPLIRIRP